MKKKICILMGITALVFLISIVIYVVLKEKCIGRSIDILLYASQAILAGFITFIGLFITITDQEAQRIANQKNEKLKEICPCFYATYVRIFGPNNFDPSAISLVSKGEPNKKMVECKFINSRNNVALNVDLVNPFDKSTYLFNT